MPLFMKYPAGKSGQPRWLICNTYEYLFFKTQPTLSHFCYRKLHIKIECPICKKCIRFRRFREHMGHIHKTGNHIDCELCDEKFSCRKWVHICTYISLLNFQSFVMTDGFWKESYMMQEKVGL